MEMCHVRLVLEKDLLHFEGALSRPQGCRWQKRIFGDRKPLNISVAPIVARHAVARRGKQLFFRFNYQILPARPLVVVVQNEHFHRA